MQSLNPKRTPQSRNTAPETYGHVPLREALTALAVVAATVLAVAAVPVGFTPLVAVVGGGLVALFVQRRVTAAVVPAQGDQR